MSDSEFDIIKKYFTFNNVRDDVNLAGGDDCSVVSVPEGKQLLITTDTLIEGVHFPIKTSAEDIAYKAIMVNLSDLAAMGATPVWLSMAITLPDINELWLQNFSRQIKAVLSEFNICLIGGDTTKGSLSITIQAMGLSDANTIMRRDGAEVGDRIFVTGELGDAAIGLEVVLNNLNNENLQSCIKKLNRPRARVKFAEELSLFSKCATDISDGLASDLGHIVKASHCGADVNLADIPISSSAMYYFEHYNENKIDWPKVLTHGDDYELCFVANKKYQKEIEALAKKHQLRVSCIGDITDTNTVALFDKGQKVELEKTGFKHF
ncbi:Thiamine-monophosphate kinase [hydrothermal vent metagenome]|uniref:Thiamine-monophosphate kinase n=1 Tax=hydrothermal vent metagenome TaxID=652676 RepID=A0A3B0X4T8_9ZZZZ